MSEFRPTMTPFSVLVQLSGHTGPQNASKIHIIKLLDGEASLADFGKAGTCIYFPMPLYKPSAATEQDNVSMGHITLHEKGSWYRLFCTLVLDNLKCIRQ